MMNNNHERTLPTDDLDIVEVHKPEVQLDLKDELEKAYRTAIGLGVPIVLETPEATVVITPRKTEEG